MDPQKMEKKKMEQIKAVIFDMDGVIFDSERLYVKCDVQVAEKYGMKNVEEVCYRCIGTTTEETMRILRAAYGEDAPIEEMFREATVLFREYCRENGMPEKPGVRELLQFLKENKTATALASSTLTEVVKQELAEAGLLGYFDVIIGGDTVKRSKPAPDIFLAAAERLGRAPEECCIIEDSYNGIRAAHAAGSFPIMVPDILQPDEEIRSLAGIVLPSLDAVREYFLSSSDLFY